MTQIPPVRPLLDLVPVVALVVLVAASPSGVEPFWVSGVAALIGLSTGALIRKIGLIVPIQPQMRHY